MSTQPPVIEIVPIGLVPVETLQGIAEAIPARFPGRVAHIGSPLPRPTYALTVTRQQYQAEPILDRLDAVRGDSERVVGVIDDDLYVPGHDFVFGVAQNGGPAALVGLARLRPEFSGGAADPALLRERAINEAVHELEESYGSARPFPPQLPWAPRIVFCPRSDYHDLDRDFP